MRHIGTLQQRAEAIRFASYLVTQGITAHAEENNGKWAIWVREEDQLGQAKDALAEFVADPANPRYEGVERTAGSRLRKENEKREAAKQNIVQMRNRWGHRAPARKRPLTIAVVLLCGALGVATEMGRDSNNHVMRTLLFCDPHHTLEGWKGETVNEKLIDIRRGQFWRVFTPAFLHGSIFHLAFNMVMFYQLGGMIEHRRRTWRLGLMIITIAVISNVAQALIPNDRGGTWNFVGLSGVVYGLFGYIWMKSRYEPTLGLFIDRVTVIVLMAFMLLGFGGAFASMHLANWAHGVGFLVGVVIAITPLLFRRTPKT